jgi:hypothetical protein
MKKLKWLLVNGRECNSRISKATEFLKLVPKWDKCINVLGECIEK